MAVGMVAAAVSLGGCASSPTTDGPPPITVTPKVPTAPPESPSVPGAPRDWSTVAQQAGPAVLRLGIQGCEASWMGSGFVIDDEHIITAAHVVVGAQSIRAQGDRLSLGLEVVRLDKATDSAILRATDDTVPLPAPVSLTDEQPALGDGTLLLGYPLSVMQLRATQGIISGFGQDVDYGPELGISLSDVIVTDAAVNGGNSGGPAFNREGDVIGLVTGKRMLNDGVPVEGTAYIVPLEQFRGLIGGSQGRRPGLERCSTESDGGILRVTIESDDIVAQDVARVLALHGDSINARQFELAWMLLGPELRERVGPLADWSAALSSTFWRELLVEEATASGPQGAVTATARVWLVTQQDAGLAPDGQQTCSVWPMEYTLQQSGADWLITNAKVVEGESAKAC